MSNLCNKSAATKPTRFGVGMRAHRLHQSGTLEHRSTAVHHPWITAHPRDVAEPQHSCTVCGRKLSASYGVQTFAPPWQPRESRGKASHTAVAESLHIPPARRKCAQDSLGGNCGLGRPRRLPNALAGHPQTSVGIRNGKYVEPLAGLGGSSATPSSGEVGDWPLEPSNFVPNKRDTEYDQPSEAGFIIPKETLQDLELQAAEAATNGAILYPPYERNQIKDSWNALMRWSKVFRTKNRLGDPLSSAQKVVVFGGGSFGTAMGAALARQKPSLEVVLLLRDPYLCRDINTSHSNTKYLKDFMLPTNVRATTGAAEAIQGAQYAVHAVPVQHSRAFLQSIKDILPSSVPIICVSKGLEVSTGQMMSEVVPSALGRKQPAVFVSGPSFAREVMEDRPTGVVAACRDRKLAQTVQSLFASQSMRVNITTDVIGVEICGALKNVLAIAAGIVEGLELGNNALAALIAQGCAEIRWLADKMGAKPATLSGLSGLGDIMLTCYGSLSRNRTVGIRLGRGETLQQILDSSTQVAEGIATAGVVVSLARRYRVSLPVLTAVAQVLENNLTPRQAVYEIMNLPQVEEM